MEWNKEYPIQTFGGVVFFFFCVDSVRGEYLSQLICSFYEFSFLFFAFCFVARLAGFVGSESIVRCE